VCDCTGAGRNHTHQRWCHVNRAVPKSWSIGSVEWNERYCCSRGSVSSTASAPHLGLPWAALSHDHVRRGAGCTTIRCTRRPERQRAPSPAAWVRLPSRSRLGVVGTPQRTCLSVPQLPAFKSQLVCVPQKPGIFGTCTRGPSGRSLSASARSRSGSATWPKSGGLVRFPHASPGLLSSLRRCDDKGPREA